MTSGACKNDGAWDPGLKSDIPQALLSRVTLFVDEHAFVSYAQALELSDFTGIPVLELYSLRPERLVTHALLVRVTSELTVPDGQRYAELGINLRSMVKVLYDNHVHVMVPTIKAEYDAERQNVVQHIHARLDEGFSFSGGNVQSRTILCEDAEKTATDAPWWSRWFKAAKPDKKQTTMSSSSDGGISALSVIENWKKELAGHGATEIEAGSAYACIEKDCLQALIQFVNSIVSHRGRMLPDHSLLARIVANKVMNTRGADVVDKVLDTIWTKAILAEGFRALPAQAKPVIMNVKGASASGKSTIRPKQRKLAEKLGIDWEDFALVSPDYWRKYLLDYESLGEHYKYGAMLTGRELELVDKKLDRRMARKAATGTFPHLLIDRFRFDSFIVDVDRSADSTLLSRFGDRVYLFFMVTHPAETVVRAWRRGITTGRYKAVDDLLYHNVEAFTGMPDLFLSWINSKDKRIHFEFLDNDVPEGSSPRTAAFGRNNTLVVLDIRLLLNVDRYRKVNINAQEPVEVFNADELAAGANVGFIKRCVERVACIVLLDQTSLKHYAYLQDGRLIWWDDSYIKAHDSNEELAAVLTVLGYSGESCSAADIESSDTLAVTLSDLSVDEFSLVGHLSECA